MADVIVTQKDGEIGIQLNGEQFVLPVTKGKVSAEGPLLDAVLALPGSKLAGAPDPAPVEIVKTF